MKIAAAPAINTVTNGVKNRSNISGIILWSLSSSRAANAATIITEMTPPRPGTNAAPKRFMSASAGCVINAASTPPSIGVPPKIFAALMPTNKFMPQKTALPATINSLINGSSASAGEIFTSKPTMPVIKPHAIKPGISGVKMLEIFLKNSLTGVALRARILSCKALASPILTSPTLTVFVASKIWLTALVTDVALPAPRMT